MTRTAIIPARFQNSHLHEAHVKLIEYALKHNDRVIVFLGDSPTRVTTDNPLSFEMRKKMVEEEYDVEVFRMPDFKYDDIWCNELDKRIANIASGEEIILLGSRDSFIKCYCGVFKTEQVDSIVVDGLSASKLRQECHNQVKNSKDWREGVIHASGYKYPTSYQAVDIAIIHFEQNKILLGKKPFEKKYRFPGGMVDCKDSCLELAAKRECVEECGYIETDNYRYVCSTRVDDWRYRNSTDKIMTTLFCANYIFGKTKASDDLSEVEWFDLNTLTDNDFEPEHRILFYNLKGYLQINSHYHESNK